MIPVLAVMACAKPEINRVPGRDEPELPDPAPGEAGDGLDICTFNIRYFNTTDPYPWSARKEPVMKFIKTVAPDLVGLQELRSTQSQDIQLALADDYGLYDIDRDTGNSVASGSGEGVGILYKKSRFTVKDKGFFWLAENPDKLPEKNSDGTYSSWHSACRRVVVWTKLEDKLNDNKTVWFFATHFDHVSSSARLNSSNLTLKQIREITKQSNIRNASCPIFLVADFNCKPGSDELAPLMAEMIDARTSAAKTDNGTTFNSFSSSTFSVIDHIFYGGPVKADVYDIDTNDYGVKYLSDHYPVLLYTSWK